MQSKPIFRYKACREYFKYARLEFGNHFQHSSWQSPTFFQQKRNGKSLKAFTLWKINNWSGAGKEKKRKKKIAKYRKNDVNNRNIENLFPDLFCCSDLQPPGREDIHSKWRVCIPEAEDAQHAICQLGGDYIVFFFVFFTWMLLAMGEVLRAISRLLLTLSMIPFILNSSGGQKSPTRSRESRFAALTDPTGLSHTDKHGFISEPRIT